MHLNMCPFERSRRDGPLLQCVILSFYAVRVTEIDKMQRATLVPLKDGAVPLKKKVPYDQLQPYMTSELHDVTGPPCNNTPPPCDSSAPPCDNIPPPCDNIPPPCDNAPPPCDNTLPPCDNTLPPCDYIPPPCENIPPPCDNIPPPCDNNAPFSNNNITNKKRAGKKQNKVLHCHANANPAKLVSTILKTNYWLTDEHMDHAQWLISKQFPDVKGFHSVLAFAGKSPKVEKGLTDFVQILNIRGDHWVVVTNIGCEENKIKVYDTLYRNMPKGDKDKLAALLNTSLPNMVIEWPSLQIQEGDSDCGLFAAAIAISLSSGIDPGQQAYDQNVMRVHLAMCFQCEEIAAFPSSHVKCEKSERAEATVDLFCHCRMPYREGEFMIECATCLDWFHRSCDKVPRTVNVKTLFNCMNCK